LHYFSPFALSPSPFCLLREIYIQVCFEIAVNMAGGDEEKAPVVAEQAGPSTTEGASEESSKEAEIVKQGDEEDTGAQIAPIVKLEEVAISTGEENEEVLFDAKAKLYRFDKDGTQWKERGVGQVKLLEHKVSKSIRLLMRQSRTLKICANHLVNASSPMSEHAGSDKTWVWHAPDFSDGELKEELFCMRFGSVESAKNFKEAYESAQKKVVDKTKEKEEVDSTAELLDKLNVESSTKAEQPEAEEKDVKETTTTSSEA